MSRAMAFGFHTIWLGGCLTARALETTHQWLTRLEHELPLSPPPWWDAAGATCK